MPSEFRSRNGWRKTVPAMREPSKVAQHCGRFPIASLRGRAQEILGDNVDVATDLRRDVGEFGMVGDRQVGRNGPGRSRPDQSPNAAAGERGIDERGIGGKRKAHPDRRAGMIFILDFGLGQSSAVMNAPVDRFETFIDVTLGPGNRQTRPRLRLRNRRSSSNKDLASGPESPTG